MVSCPDGAGKTPLNQNIGHKPLTLSKGSCKVVKKGKTNLMFGFLPHNLQKREILLV
jgi:hypothetical protein